MIETSIGLPNSCSVCGLPVTDSTWWAADPDAARAGGGRHAVCYTAAAVSIDSATPKNTTVKKVK